MKTRKLILIVADIVLLAVLITQCVFFSGDGSKTFKLKDTPDEILITHNGENVALKFENNSWIVGDRKYPVNVGTVDSMIDSLSSIICIDKVGNTGKVNAIEKYELDDSKKITVTAKKEGTVLRSVEIGKNGATSSQSFITVDGGNDIYIATGSLGSIFTTTESDIRSKIVWDFDEADINAVEVINFENTKEGTKESYSITKNGSGENLKWAVSGIYKGESVEQETLDTEKTQSWFDTLGNLTTSLWYDETKNMGGIKIATTKITHGAESTTIDIYELPSVKYVDENESTTEESSIYYGKSNETPYPFELTSYTMERLNKKLEELTK